MTECSRGRWKRQRSFSSVLIAQSEVTKDPVRLDERTALRAYRREKRHPEEHSDEGSSDVLICRALLGELET